MKVLHINTRIDRGGSAIFMNNLGRAQESMGITPTFFALSKGGFNFKINGKISFLPYFNYITHKFLGKDYFTVRGNELRKHILQCDIVHLHVIHSHILNFEDLFKFIERNNKPVVITLHDKWYFTGRCAIPMDCSKDKTLCRKCPDRKVYPASYNGNTFFLYKIKFSFYRRYSRKLAFVSPSEWIKTDIEQVYPDLNIRHIKNGINIFDDDPLPIEKGEDKIVFITNDFKDKNKVNYHHLNSLISSGHRISLVGSNQPDYKEKNVQPVNKQVPNTEVQKILRIHKCFLLLSSFENYPTILIEALANGCCVLTTKNNGAVEILKSFRYGKDYLFIDQMKEGELEEMFFYNNYDNCEARMNFSKKIFDISHTAQRYMKVYKSFST